MSDSKPPVVLELGRAKKKYVEMLREGEGPIADEVRAMVAEVRTKLGAEVEGREILPVVIVYTKKQKQRGLLGL